MARVYMKRRGIAPLADHLPLVVMPSVCEAVLSNGLRMMVYTSRSSVTTVHLVFDGAGGYYDPSHQYGLATVAAAMLQERPNGCIREELERRSVSYGIETPAASTAATARARCLNEDFEDVCELLADMLLRPTVTSELLAATKQRCVELIERQLTNDELLAQHILAGSLSGPAHPSGRLVPSTDGIRGIDVEDVLECYRGRYRPQECAIAVATSLPTARVFQTIAASFEGWTHREDHSPRRRVPLAPTVARLRVVPRPGSLQAQIVVGGNAVRRFSSHFDVCELLMSVLGSGPMGRLFERLRERSSLVYSASASLVTHRYCGRWLVQSQTGWQLAERVLADILDELRRCRDDELSHTELSDRQCAMISALAIRSRDVDEVLERVTLGWLHRLPSQYWDDRSSKLTAVTPRDLQKAAIRLFALDHLHAVVVGPPELSTLDSFAGVDVPRAV